MPSSPILALLISGLLLVQMLIGIDAQIAKFYEIKPARLEVVELNDVIVSLPLVGLCFIFLPPSEYEFRCERWFADMHCGKSEKMPCRLSLTCSACSLRSLLALEMKLIPRPVRRGIIFGVLFCARYGGVGNYSCYLLFCEESAWREWC